MGGAGLGPLRKWGAHQGFAVAAGNRAQGAALLEVVYEAHTAAQHRAGAQEVRDHLLPTNAAIPGGSGTPQFVPSTYPTTSLTLWGGSLGIRSSLRYPDALV